LYQAEFKSYVIRGLFQSQVAEDKALVDKYAKDLFANKLADPTYQFSAALSLVNIGKLSDSKVLINNLNDSYPRNLEYLSWLARYEDEISKNYSESIRIRNSIAVFDPWNASNYLEMGKLYKKNNDLAGMNSMLEKILSFAPNDDIARVAKQELA
jgi:tetratricopeptide (TPR) repeat protein